MCRTTLSLPPGVNINGKYKYLYPKFRIKIYVKKAIWCHFCILDSQVTSVVTTSNMLLQANFHPSTRAAGGRAW